MRKDDLPETIKRSPPHAQRTYAKTLEAAEEQYGEGERARRTAIASLKHKYEKVGDHWERKAGGRAGPSDPRSTKSTPQKRRNVGETFGGVDYYGHTKAELYERAKKLGVEGRSNMTKAELARAIASKQ